MVPTVQIFGCGQGKVFTSLMGPPCSCRHQNWIFKTFVFFFLNWALFLLSKPCVESCTAGIFEYKTTSWQINLVILYYFKSFAKIVALQNYVCQSSPLDMLVCGLTCSLCCFTKEISFQEWLCNAHQDSDHDFPDTPKSAIFQHHAGQRAASGIS